MFIPGHKADILTSQHFVLIMYLLIKFCFLIFHLHSRLYEPYSLFNFSFFYF